MRLPGHLMKLLLSKFALLTALLGGFQLLEAPGAKGQSWDQSNRRVAYANHQLHEAIEHYGYLSPEARYWRHEQHEAYEQLERSRRNESRERARQEREWHKQQRREHEWREHHKSHDDSRDRDDR
jgi:hypothetical protein